MRLKELAATAAIVAALGIAGCGGDDDDSSEPAAVPTPPADTSSSSDATPSSDGSCPFNGNFITEVEAQGVDCETAVNDLLVGHLPFPLTESFTAGEYEC